jgi:hypothetical protein
MGFGGYGGNKIQHLKTKTAHADLRMTTDRLIYKNLSSYLAFKLMIAREILTFFNIFFCDFFFILLFAQSRTHEIK